MAKESKETKAPEAVNEYTEIVRNLAKVVEKVNEYNRKHGKSITGKSEIKMIDLNE